MDSSIADATTAMAVAVTGTGVTTAVISLTNGPLDSGGLEQASSIHSIVGYIAFIQEFILPLDHNDDLQEVGLGFFSFLWFFFFFFGTNPDIVTTNKIHRFGNCFHHKLF